MALKSLHGNNRDKKKKGKNEEKTGDVEDESEAIALNE